MNLVDPEKQKKRGSVELGDVPAQLFTQETGLSVTHLCSVSGSYSQVHITATNQNKTKQRKSSHLTSKSSHNKTGGDF